MGICVVGGCTYKLRMTRSVRPAAASGFACRLTAAEGIPDGRAEAATARQATMEAFILLKSFCFSFLFGFEKGVFVRANVRIRSQPPVTLGIEEEEK